MGIEEIIDGLYELPPEEFTRERNRAERELRTAGERELADRVKALRKPTAAAGAVNRLVRTHRVQVEAFLRAAATLRDAQFAGKGDVASAARGEREAIEQLVSLGGEAVRPTLQAAAVDDNTASDLLKARLVREPEPPGFGTLLAHAEPTPAPSARRRSPARAKPDDRAAKARLHEATRILAAAATEERQMQRQWEKAREELEKAQAAVEKAQRDVERIRGR